MGGSLARALLAKNIVDRSGLYLSGNKKDSLKPFSKIPLIKITLNNKKAVKDASIVLLAVKPNEIKEVAQEILDKAIKNHPDKILPHIIQVLESGNCDAQLNLGVILKKHPEFILKLPSEIICTCIHIQIIY